MNNIKAPSKRILALDVLRGFTIAGMIMVNNPGDGLHVFTPLDHAEWIGLTPTDLVFPFFMFIMGVSTYISLRKYDFKPSRSAVIKILRRTVVIFLIGLLIGWFARVSYGFDNRYLFVTDERGAVHALDRNSGSSMWKQDKLLNRRVTSPLVKRGAVVVSDAQGVVHFLGRDDGAFVARLTLDGTPVVTPPQSVDTMILIQTSGGTITAIEVQ